MNSSLLAVLFFAGLGVFSSADDATCNKEKPTAVKLKEDVLCGYDKNFPPAYHNGNSTQVAVSMLLKSFSYVPHMSYLSISCWLILYWSDAKLKWNPSDYNSIKKIHINSADIWVPDLSVYNKHVQESPGVLTSVDCLLYNSGTVICVVPTSVDGLCVPDMSKYPLDTQNCTLRFGSWVHSGEEVNFTISSSPISYDDLVPNGEWDLVKTNATKNAGIYDCCPNNTYPSLFFQFVLKRHGGHQVIVVLMPMIVMATLSLATLWLTPLDPTRVILMCCNILCQVFFVEFISWQIPPTGPKLSSITRFARDSMLLSVIVIVLTIVLRNLMRSSGDVPKWVPSFISLITNNRAGRVLAPEYYVKGASLMKNDEDAGNNAAENAQEGDLRSRDWTLFAKIVDRLFFVIFAIVYAFMFIAFVP